MANENPDQTHQPTALVHEAWLKLVQQRERRWQKPQSLLCRRRRGDAKDPDGQCTAKMAQRHGGGQQRVELSDGDAAASSEDAQVLAISEALEKLVRLDPQRAEVVKLRYFVGLINF